MWMIEHLFATRGVQATTPIVVYDDQSGIRAARAFWFLEYFGHPSVRLLDGGFGAWTREGFPVTRAPRRRRQQRVDGHARLQKAIATWRDVRDAIGADDSVILDTRSRRRILRHDRACGARRRGSRRRPHRVDPQSRPRRRLQAGRRAARMYEEAGVTPDREVITYCQGGYRAAHSYLALRLLGYPKVRNYVGSWKEWGDRHGSADRSSRKPSTEDRILTYEQRHRLHQHQPRSLRRGAQGVSRDSQHQRAAAARRPTSAAAPSGPPTNCAASACRTCG